MKFLLKVGDDHGRISQRIHTKVYGIIILYLVRKYT